MKIIKKTAFKKAVLLKEEFREITKKFTEIKNKGGNAGLSRTENISELNFFFVIEYVNIADKINYEKIFPNDDFIIDIEGLLNEQDKIIQHINKRKENYPDIFYKLGFVNEVSNCFLIATRKPSITNVSTKNTINTVSIKLDNNSLPKDIEIMCSEFYDSKFESNLKEQEEFKRFNKLSFEEHDVILQNIIQRANMGTIDFFYTEKEKQPSRKNSNNIHNFSGDNNTIKIEQAISKNLEKVTSVEFLKSLLSKAEQKENYELCAKIRDRLEFLFPKM